MASHISEDIIDRIKRKAQIVDVVSKFIKLRKVGTRYTGICPFHEDRHDGNFIVYPQGNCYKCFTCDAKGGALQFLMDHKKWTFMEALRWLGNEVHEPVDDIPVDYKPEPLPPPPPPLPTLYLDRKMAEDRCNLQTDTFYHWLTTSIKWDATQRARIDQVMRDYLVGHSVHGHTIWWQIDEEQRVRTGKLMKYKADGHRDKEASWNFDWIHSLLARHPQYRHIYDPDKQEVRQTLFGMHLLDHYRKGRQQQRVCIVESEKTAVIMATAYGNTPSQVWMACGGIRSLSREKLQPIIEQKRDIILYPDRDGITEWRAKAANIGYSRIKVDTTPVTKWWKPQDGEKADIADVVVRIINEGGNQPP